MSCRLEIDKVELDLVISCCDDYLNSREKIDIEKSISYLVGAVRANIDNLFMAELNKPRIIEYGSVKRGTNAISSDLDLFISCNLDIKAFIKRLIEFEGFESLCRSVTYKEGAINPALNSASISLVKPSNVVAFPSQLDLLFARDSGSAPDSNLQLKRSEELENALDCPGRSLAIAIRLLLSKLKILGYLENNIRIPGIEIDYFAIGGKYNSDGIESILNGLIRNDIGNQLLDAKRTIAPECYKYFVSNQIVPRVPLVNALARLSTARQKSP